MTLTYNEEYQAIQGFHRDFPTFINEKQTQELLKALLISFLSISIFFVACSFIVRKVLVSMEKKDTTTQQNGSNNNNNISTLTVHKIAYQITNLLMNAALAVMGIYFYNQYSSSRATQHLEGQDIELLQAKLLEHYEGVHWLSAAQLGYNVWAIPVGLFVVDESNAMLGHHSAVIVVSIMSAWFTLGFQFFTPFMYGILEISSVPLAVMNTFKDHPEWVQQRPVQYLVIRLIFCFTFLYVRWYLYLPIKYDFLRLCGMVGLSFDEWYYRLYYFLVVLASSFLLLLQLYWGVLICRGLVKVAIKAAGGGKKKKK